MKKYEELLVSLRQVIRAIDLYSKKLSKETGLTSPQLLVLLSIAEHDGAMVKEVAKTINLSSATITSIVDRLEKRGLVTRTRSTTDKRKVGISLTDQGKEIIKDSPKPLQDHFIARFESMQEWEQSQMLATMQRISSMMDAEKLDVSPVLEVGQIYLHEY
ncbi:MarR family winged helix-turn-helix transcriptional regulator [Shewanella glacialimarina]|jgi:DNA-binding MarR family transcriptional regulator|uniref:MarR family winged helix-turn-helix transcriptional regulator n=1 Tax=Shewanella glacialimarina TaxID=2590884 RepID=UPI001CF800D3|nr:MarR family transcriptional regulator [Shewanella glacialimarina]UCX03200.1 MarR family transcriptional regulator [Shewanella glacialimarina]